MSPQARFVGELEGDNFDLTSIYRAPSRRQVSTVMAISAYYQYLFSILASETVTIPLQLKAYVSV